MVIFGRVMKHADHETLRNAKVRSFDMMIFGHASAEQLSFKLWDGSRAKSLGERIQFEPDAVVGDAVAPFRFQAAA